MKTPHIIDVLAIAAHPDDAEIQSGGTLLKMASLGYTTGILDLTRGESSTRGSADERATEAQEAARVLGLSFRKSLDLGDGRLEDSEANRHALVTCLRTLRPKIVLTHYWEEPHPDHGVAACLVRAAAYLAGVGGWASGHGGDRHRPHALLHFGLPRWIPPSFVIDISPWADQKAQAIRCHKSQVHDSASLEPETRVSDSTFLGHVESRQRSLGALIQTAHAEAFLVKEALVIDDPVRMFPRPMSLFQ